MEVIAVGSLLLGLASSIGLWRVYMRSRSMVHLLGGWFVLMGILTGARIGFVLLHLEYFTIHAREIPMFWLGGLSGVGGVWGGVLWTLLLSLFIRKNRLFLFDELSGFVLPITVAVWISAWLLGTFAGFTHPYDRRFSLMLPAGFPSWVAQWFPALVAILFLVVLSLAEYWTRVSKPGKRGVWLVLLVCLLNLGLCVVYPGQWRTLLGMKADIFLWLITSSLFLLSLFFLYLHSGKAHTIGQKSDYPEVVHEAKSQPGAI